MLKIKDNIDLKELEKFRFKNMINEFYIKNVGKNKSYIIDIDTRELSLQLDYHEVNIIIIKNILDEVYDLIKADMVEKVVEDV